MEPLIRCENVTVGYGREAVLENVKLEISKGVFLPFSGPNGAGKTTLLRTILGLIRPLAGRITTPFSRIPAGYVPQHKSVDPLFPLTARDIIRMGFYPRCGWWGKIGREEKKQLDQILEDFELVPHAGKPYRELSGGTKQKTLVARALVSGAEVFVLDEPASELDERAEHEVFRHLLRLVREQGKTVLTVHHGNNSALLRSAPEVCLVQHGKVKIVKTSDLSKSAEEIL